MSEPIGPGDLVECVEIARRSGHESGFRVGSIYTVAKVGTCSVWRTPWLHLVHMPTPRDVGRNAEGWATSAFRLVSRRADFETFLTEIKTPREDVREPERTA